MSLLISQNFHRREADHLGRTVEIAEGITHRWKLRNAPDRFKPVYFDKAHQTAKIAAGRVYLPVKASWLKEFEKEVLQFPAGRYDDQVDSMVLFLKAMDYAISQLIINPNWRPR